MKKHFNSSNPWSKLNLVNGEYFLEEDWKELRKRKNANMLLSCASLPEPFSGNPDSNVVCLNANPGEADRLYEKLFGLGEYIRLTKETLEGKASHSLWYDLKDHSGYCWLRNITRELRKDFGRNPDLFMIDYFPYHSTNTFRFPGSLPSYDFTNQLVKTAIDKGKIIIILRLKEKWLERIASLLKEDKDTILQNHKQIVCVNSSQNICLSRNNLGEHNYYRVLLALNNNNIHFTLLSLLAPFIGDRYGFRHAKCLDMASQYMLSKKDEKLEASKMNKYRDELFGKIDSNEII